VCGAAVWCRPGTGSKIQPSLSVLTAPRAQARFQARVNIERFAALPGTVQVVVPLAATLVVSAQEASEFLVDSKPDEALVERPPGPGLATDVHQGAMISRSGKTGDPIRAMSARVETRTKIPR
jgi:hypothetical protein